MSKNKTKTGEKVPEKKLNRTLIASKLDAAFSDLKPLVGKKKFERAIKKAARLLNKDFPKKSMDNFRKQYTPIQSETEVRDDTNLLIEELP